MQQNYIYYRPIESTEHMLYANEIADIYNQFFKHVDIISPKEVHNLIKSFCMKHEIACGKYYYATRNGLKKVYPKCIYHPAMMEYAKTFNIELGGSV